MTFNWRRDLRTGLLNIIVEKGPLYGLEIVREVERDSGGEVRLTATNLYPALHMFEQRGLVRVETCPPPDGGGLVNYYTATDEGRRALEVRRAAPRTFLERVQRLLKR